MEIKKLSYGWGVKLAVLLIICVQYTVTITSLRPALIVVSNL